MPKIKRIDVISLEFSMKPEDAYGMARALHHKRLCSLIEVETDEGIHGIGETAGPTHAITAYLDVVKPFLLGRSVHDFDIIAAGIYNRFYHAGLQNHMVSCLGGISVACKDAIGKTLGVRVCELLGGQAADRFACYATTGYLTHASEADLERQLDGIRGAGFKAVKIKIGMGPASDLQRVRTARQMLGDDVLLMVDINGNYTPDIALASLRKIEPFDIHWCEEPLPPTDVRGYAELRARSPVSIAAGEAFFTVQDFKRLVDARGLDILQPSIAACGGFGQAKAIALLAEMNNLRVSPSVWGGAVSLAAALHFAASLPTSPHSVNVPFPLMIEYDTAENPLRSDVLVDSIEAVAGNLSLPAGNGLGVTLDPARIGKYRIH